MQTRIDTAAQPSFIDNGRVRLGIDLSLGGAITYLSRSGDDRNLINSFDWGRQIQMSHYAGPVPFAPGGKRPSKTWEGLGWNPIQSGDSFGHRSRVLEHRNDGRSLFVKCVPMQWPLDDEPGECTFSSWLRLDGDTVQVRGRLNNARTDRTQYPGRHQELPAIYTNGPWWRLLTYTGDKPFTGDALTTAPAVFPWTGWQATENWAALVDASGFGVGVWEPGVVQMIGGFAGKPGAGGPKDAPTGYIAPLYSEIIDHNIEYEYRYTLIVGRVEAIRRHVYDHARRPEPPRYRFAKDRQHWTYYDATDAGWPIRGELKVALKPGSTLMGPDALWQAERAPILLLDAAFPAGCPAVNVAWKRHGEKEFGPECRLRAPILGDGKYRTHRIDLSAAPAYRGAITGLRLGPEVGAAGTELRLRSIRFG